MEEYRVRVSKDYLAFAAGHFITYGGGKCEKLHGHNYRAGVTLTGALDPHALVFDFVQLKREMETILDPLDHRMLLAADNQVLEIDEREEEVEVRHDGRRYLFPSRDVVLLPVSNTTAEMLASWIAEQLAARLRELGVQSLRELEIEVEESPGQSAVFRLALRD
jgi:6-pyruvoyltetrahydropterin/6-carboxytetrahydropterin synthase